MYRIQVLRKVILVGLMVAYITALVFRNYMVEDNSGAKHLAIELSDKEFMEIMSQRLNNIQFVCKKENKYRQSLNARNLFWFKEERIVYCPVWKSATSTWLHNLVDISSTTKEKKEEVRKQYRPVEQLQHLGAVKPSNRQWTRHVSSLKSTHNMAAFMTVRHPFERLVSAYRDKLERNNLKEPFYYRSYGKKIVEKYRHKALSVLGEDFFSELNNYGTMLKISNNRRPNSDLPSFWEFAQSVIDRYNIDMHWKPMYEYCAVCRKTYLKAFRYILKFEELQIEEPAFLKHVHWDNKVNKTIKLNSNRPEQMTSSEITQLYFSILSDEDIIKLYKVYELDFLLFSYTFTIGNISLPSSTSPLLGIRSDQQHILMKEGSAGVDSLKEVSADIQYNDTAK